MAIFLTDRECQSILNVRQFLEEVKRDIQSLVLPDHPCYIKYNKPVEITATFFNIPRRTLVRSCDRAKKFII